MRTVLKDTLDERIPVRENGKTRYMSRREVLIRGLANKAVTLDPRWVDSFLKMINRYLPEEADVPVSPEVDRAERDAQRIKAYMAAILWDEDLPDDLD